MHNFNFVVSLFVSAQTTGLIYKPASNGGNKILDPNGDGYVSKTATGFNGTNDEGAAFSEIAYRAFPAMMNEPLSDLKTGASGGHTDFATSQYTGTSGSPLAAYFDGKNFLFRARLGGQSSASKGYSVLIDTDNTFSGSGANPGFEFEVVLATNFDVKVIKHTGTVQQVLFSGSADQYSQKAVAATTGGSNPDYFYDFYVPLSAFNGGITTSTPLRMSGITVTSAQSGISGTASDIGGIDDRLYGENPKTAWSDIISTFPPASLSNIQTGEFPLVMAKPPVVNGPILSGTTSVSGSSIEPANSFVDVYQNGVLIGSATVLANGTWTLSDLSQTTLIAGQTITARVRVTNKSTSNPSAGVVVAAGPCNTAPPVITGPSNANKGLMGTTTVTGTVKIYQTGNTTPLYNVPVTANVIWTQEFSNQGGSLTAGTYYATVTPSASGSCESGNSNQFCYTGSKNFYSSEAPTITTSALTQSSTTLTGTTPVAGSTISITRNGVQITSFTIAANTTTWSYSLAGITLANGDVFYARATAPSTICSSVSGRSNPATVTYQVQSTAPVITGSYCGTTTAVSGTSTEATGTQIHLFINNVLVSSPAGPHALVNGYGTWTATGLSIPAGSTITARATAAVTGKTQSIASNSVTVSTPLVVNTNTENTLTVNTPVEENSTSLTGKAPASSIVNLFINGARYVDATSGAPLTVQADGSGNWVINNISPFELYAGAQLTVSAVLDGGCESARSAPVTVQCKSSVVPITATLKSSKICPGTTATVNLSTSVAGTIYTIYNGATVFGTSVLGNGGAISLQSASVVTAPITLTVKATRIGASCEASIASLVVDLYPAVPNAYTLSASSVSGCPNLSTVITVNAAQTGYSYQLINNTTKAAIGTPVTPATDGSFSFPVITVPATTTYGVMIKSTSTQCTTENENPKTVTVTITGPSVSNAVTIDHAKVCVGTGTTIRVATQNNNLYTYKIYDKANPTTAIATFQGTGAVVATAVGPFPTTGSRNYYIEVSGGSCTARLSNEISVEVVNGTPAAASAGMAQVICGSTATLQGSDPAPGTGQWTLKSGPGSVTFSSAAAANSAVSGLVSGTYEFTWTVTSTCGAPFTSAQTVAVTVNCPAEYSIKTTKFVSQYQNGDVLATASDVDGGIISAALSGGALPPGTSLDPVTGALTVTNKSLLQAGNYSFVATTTDSFNKTTDSRVVLRMYAPNAAPVPLPVELVYFAAHCENNKYILNWVTASEVNNKLFEVERSEDGLRFDKIGHVTGNGSTTKSFKYRFVDSQPLAEITYYRLKQIDLNGKATYSKIISLKACDSNSGTSLQFYPNPFRDNVNVLFAAPQAGETKIIVYDLQSRAVFEQDYNASLGINELTLSLQHLSDGMYIVKIAGQGFNITGKLLK